MGAGNFTGIITDGFHDGLVGGKLTKYGPGTLILSGANNYTGATTITGGILQAGAVNTLSQFSAVTVDTGGTLDLNNFSQRIGSLAGSGSVTLGAATLTTGVDNTNTTFSGGISGTGGLTKIGTGTMTLTGTNTYSGATTVNRGTLLIDTATNTTVLNPLSTLSLGGGRFQMRGVGGTVQNQELAGFSITGGANVVAIDNNGGTSTTLDLDASGINRSGNATVDFSAVSGTLGANAIIRTGQGNDVTGIIGAYATVNGGAALATNVGGVIVAYAGYVDISAAGGVIADDTNSNVRINSDSGTVTLGAGTTNIHTLTQNTGGVTVVDTGGGTLRLGEIGGLFLTPQSGDLTIGTTPNQGFLRAGGNVDGVAGEIIVGNFSGSSLTINSVIENNGGGIVSLTKTGTGSVTLAGTNTYTGLTTVNEGALNLNATAGTNAINGNVFVNGGSVVLQQSDQIVDAAIVTVAAGSLEIGGNNETVGGVVLSGGAINGSGGTLTSGTNYDVQSGSIGAILGGAVGLDKTTDGTVVLTGQNTYSGATTINAGTLRTDASLVISTASAVTVNAGGRLDINDSVQSVGSITGAGSIVLGYGELRTGSDNTSTTFSGVIEGYPDVPTIFGTQPGGSLTKLGAGTLTLTNENLYSGATTISAGTSCRRESPMPSIKHLRCPWTPAPRLI